MTLSVKNAINYRTRMIADQKEREEIDEESVTFIH
jgi:hypothetical protein